MTASASNNAKYSYFTLALLEDSGWYQANYSKAEALVYGQYEGCGFIFNTCIDLQTKKANFPEFCSNEDEDSCSFDHLSRGVCAFYTDNQSSFSYYGNGTRGADYFDDGCTSVMQYSNGHCDDTSIQLSAYLPEVYGNQSRCFAGTLLANNYHTDNILRIGCY